MALNLTDTFDATVVTVKSLIRKIMELKQNRDNYHQFRYILNVMRSHLMEMESSSSQCRVSPAVERCTKELMAVLEEARIQFPEDLPNLRGSLTLQSNMKDVKMKLKGGFKKLDMILARQDLISKTACLRPSKPLMQSSITHSNLQAVQSYDPVREDLQKIGKLFTDVYVTFKEGRKRRQITPTDFVRNAGDQFEDFRINKKSRNTSFPTLKVTSEGFSKLKEFFVGTASAVTGMVTATEVKEFTRGTLAIMGNAHLIGAALLVVVDLLKRWEMISKNKEECLDLLENMANLVSYLYQISQRSTDISRMGDCHLQEIIRECMETIMDGYDLIWSKLTAAKRKRLMKNISTSGLISLAKKTPCCENLSLVYLHHTLCVIVTYKEKHHNPDLLRH